jgi:hypothetical protein
VPCNELVETQHGLMWRGVVIFNETQVKPSQDQLCHVCIEATGVDLSIWPGQRLAQDQEPGAPAVKREAEEDWGR